MSLYVKCTSFRFKELKATFSMNKCKYNAYSWPCCSQLMRVNIHFARLSPSCVTWVIEWSSVISYIIFVFASHRIKETWFKLLSIFSYAPLFGLYMWNLQWIEAKTCIKMHHRHESLPIFCIINTFQKDCVENCSIFYLLSIFFSLVYSSGVFLFIFFNIKLEIQILNPVYVFKKYLNDNP